MPNILLLLHSDYAWNALNPETADASLQGPLECVAQQMVCTTNNIPPSVGLSFLGRIFLLKTISVIVTIDFWSFQDYVYLLQGTSLFLVQIIYMTLTSNEWLVIDIEKRTWE